MIMNDLPKITPQQAKQSYARILAICSSQSSWNDKGNALRTVFDNLLDELCKNNGMAEGLSKFQERRESLYPEGSEERKRLGKLSWILNRLQHRVDYTLTKSDFNDCLKMICEHIAKSSGAPYPDELALMLKPMEKNNSPVKRPVIILKELYCSLDQIKHASLFLQSYHDNIMRKDFEGFRDIQFDLITYAANPILSPHNKGKKNTQETASCTDTGYRKEIATAALEKTIETIKDRYWSDLSDNSKAPFFFWIFYDMNLEKDDDITDDINNLISELDISFYPIVVSRGKDSEQTGIRAKELFPKSKNVVTQHHPELPDNLFKTIFSAISATNQKLKKPDRK